MANIHPKLKTLNFDNVDPYDFAKILFEECNEQSLFEPLHTSIPETIYVKLLEPWFTNFTELLPLVNQQFFEYMRRKVLDVNGFKKNKENELDVKVYLYQ
jgi:hypothetical protein